MSDFTGFKKPERNCLKVIVYYHFDGIFLFYVIQITKSIFYNNRYTVQRVFFFLGGGGVNVRGFRVANHEILTHE